MASSSSDLEHNAREAFIDDHFVLAVDLYSQAIALSPSNPRLFADPSQANLKLRNLTESVADANRAIELDASLHKAYMRKGNVCFELEEYHIAKAALEKGVALAPGDTRFANLIKKCEECIVGESGEVLKQSSEKLPTYAVSKDVNQALSVVLNPETLVSNLKPKYNVTVDSPGEDAYHFQYRLFGKIKPEKCRYEVLQTKIEIRLAKAEPVNWTSLEFSNTAFPHKVNALSGNAPQRPFYPSSKPRGADWDKIEAQVKKEEKEEKLDGKAASRHLQRRRRGHEKSNEKIIGGVEWYGSLNQLEGSGD